MSERTRPGQFKLSNVFIAIGFFCCAAWVVSKGPNWPASLLAPLLMCTGIGVLCDRPLYGLLAGFVAILLLSPLITSRGL